MSELEDFESTSPPAQKIKVEVQPHCPDKDECVPQNLGEAAGSSELESQVVDDQKLADLVKGERDEFEAGLKRLGYEGDTSVREVLRSLWYRKDFPEILSAQEAGVQEQIEREVRVFPLSLTELHWVTQIIVCLGEFSVGLGQTPSVKVIRVKPCMCVYFRAA